MRLLSLTHASQALGIAVVTLKRLIAAGEIQAVHVGAGASRIHLRVDSEALARFAMARITHGQSYSPAPKLKSNAGGATEYDFLALRNQLKEQKRSSRNPRM